MHPLLYPTVCTQLLKNGPSIDRVLQSFIALPTDTGLPITPSFAAAHHAILPENGCDLVMQRVEKNYTPMDIGKAPKTGDLVIIYPQNILAEVVDARYHTALIAWIVNPTNKILPRVGFRKELILNTKGLPIAFMTHPIKTVDCDPIVTVVFDKPKEEMVLDIKNMFMEYEWNIELTNSVIDSMYDVFDLQVNYACISFLESMYP